MKYTVKFETIAEVSTNIGIVADKDGIVILSFGFKELGEKTACVLKLIAAHEELTMQFATDKPENYAGTASKVTVKAAFLSTVLSSLLSLKSDIFFDISETGLVIGVAGKAQVPVQVLSETKGAMEGKPPMLCLAFSGKEFLEFLRKGLLCSSDEAGENGLNNSVMVINTETGDVSGASTDQYRLSYACVKGKISPNKNNPEAEAAALKAYLEKTGADPKELPVILPRQEIEHIRALIGNNDAFRMILDERHVTLVLGGNRTLYMATQGATMPMAVSVIKKVVDSGTLVRASLDCEELEKAVSFMNAMNDAAGGGASVVPIRLTVKDGVLELKGIKSENLRTTVKVDSAGDSDVSVLVNGKYLKSVLSILKKGGIVMGLSTEPLLATFANGTIAKGEDGTGKIGLLGTRDAEAVEDAEVEDAETGATEE